MALKLGRLGRAKTRPHDDQGRMSLGQHIAELRNRLVKSVLAILVGMVFGWIFYEPLLNIVVKPFRTSVAALFRSKGLNPTLTMTGVADAFTFQIKISLVFGLLLASPIWLYQLWAFIAPGLHRQEKKWAYLFSACAVPMFAGGIAVAYWTLPKGLQILIGFTPDGVQNLIELPRYLDFSLRTMLVFGIAFQIPLIVVLLSIAGVVSSRMLAKSRPYVIIGVFVFGAIATPSGDPITLLFLAGPMTVLFLAAELIARLLERRRASRSAEPADDSDEYRDEPPDEPDDPDHQPDASDESDATASTAEPAPR